jgi:DNA-binding transcriptional ArsR family regulator
MDLLTPVPDYELAATVQADTPEKLRAVVDPLRRQILHLVMDRAATVTELALALGRPKSSVAYHVEVLVDVGMLQVVRTRRVRAIEEKFYGRTGRTIVFNECALPDGAMAPNMLTEAIGEARFEAKETRSTIRHARISADRLAEFFDRVDELAEEFTMLPREGDVVYGFVAAAYPTDLPILPPAAER